MRKTLKNVLLLAAASLLAGATVASAQDSLTPPEDMPVPSRQYVVDLGVGALVQPKYEGSDKLMITPMPIINFARFYFPGYGQVTDGEIKKRGFFFYPSFNYVGERKASDAAHLTGTNKVDWALELGAGAGFRYDWFQAFVEVRQGINGHSGQVGRLGADVIFSPMERLQLSLGPRADFASGDYMRTYFGVSAAEAGAAGSVLTAYRPSGGFKTLGLLGRASYAMNDTTSLHLQAGWDRYVGDAAKSPIVKTGERDRFTIGAGVTYRFAFDLFD
ncbi:MipA/OmpV family protein [Stappia sp.]|jgi:outer membrane scaffolding protein for murein synthesis (MipA/OmpV family)|uniref:MipA/OmpV family protein n=1 Tax=Stappia sp. TaxID=1870903 RepID=UPI003A98FCC4